MTEERLQDLPYDERRLIVVARPEAVSNDRESWTGPAVEAVVGVALAVATRSALSGIVAAGPPLLRAVTGFQKQAAAEGLHEDLRVVSPTEARELTFPVGHPHKKVVYVGHPLEPAVYQPFASFHSFLFDHKVAEALRLIRSLGAESISITRVSGWKQTAGVRVDVPVQGTDVGLSADLHNSAEAYVETKMTLKPTKDPYVPDDLVWFPHEPLWKEVAEARLEAGLTSFELEVKSSDDYGVTVGLKAMIEKNGLDIGGEFVQHQSTVWKMKGSFAVGD